MEEIALSSSPTPVSPIPADSVTLASSVICPSCHVEVRPTDYFCYNCGHNLKPKPLSTTFLKQLGLYVGSTLLPPFGLIWGWPYLKEATFKAKMIGVVTIFLTITSLIISTYYALQFAQNINDQVNQEMSRIQGFH